MKQLQSMEKEIILIHLLVLMTFGGKFKDGATQVISCRKNFMIFLMLRNIMQDFLVLLLYFRCIGVCLPEL